MPGLAPARPASSPKGAPAGCAFTFTFGDTQDSREPPPKWLGTGQRRAGAGLPLVGQGWLLGGVLPVRSPINRLYGVGQWPTKQV